MAAWVLIVMTWFSAYAHGYAVQKVYFATAQECHTAREWVMEADVQYTRAECFPAAALEGEKK